jgi:hypothetical protein
MLCWQKFQMAENMSYGAMLHMVQILLFGGFTELTPEPISIDETPLQIVFAKPITALNCSASFNVNTSEQLASVHSFDAVKEARSKIQDGCIKIELQSKEHSAVVFRYGAEVLPEGKAIRINLKNRSLPTDRKYHSMYISSCIALRGVEINWYNHGKIECEH